MNTYRINEGYHGSREIVTYYEPLKKDVVVMRLNQALIAQHQLGEDQVAKIVQLHIRRMNLADEMRDLNPVEDRQKLLDLNESYTEIQFALQEAWGFAQNRDFHDWFDVPHCTCPKMDNRERKGTKYQIISFDCIYHGRPGHGKDL